MQFAYQNMLVLEGRHNDEVDPEARIVGGVADQADMLPSTPSWRVEPQIQPYESPRHSHPTSTQFGSQAGLTPHLHHPLRMQRCYLCQHIFMCLMSRRMNMPGLVPLQPWSME